MIEIPEGARFFRKSESRVDVWYGGRDPLVFGDTEVNGWAVFISRGRVGSVTYLKENSGWKTVVLRDEVIPEAVKELVK